MYRIIYDGGRDSLQAPGTILCVQEFSEHRFFAFIFICADYEGCSNMNASTFITFFTYMLRQNIKHFWKELFVAFQMAPTIRKH